MHLHCRAFCVRASDMHPFRTINPMRLSRPSFTPAPPRLTNLSPITQRPAWNHCLSTSLKVLLLIERHMSQASGLSSPDLPNRANTS